MINCVPTFMSASLNCSRPQLEKASRLLDQAYDSRQKRILFSYCPYAKQKVFHSAGAEHQERLFLAGNQLGKTLAAAMEWAMHLSGLYPPWWRGRRFARPVRLWACGVTAESTRDNPQRLLLGPGLNRADWGRGTLPAYTLKTVHIARGPAYAVDSLCVQHGSGGVSNLAFRSYERGREKWQGESLDGVWFDEEPPLDVYIEGLARTVARGGMTVLTLTPLLGMTEIIRRFFQRNQDGFQENQNPFQRNQDNFQGKQDWAPAPLPSSQVGGAKE